MIPGAPPESRWLRREPRRQLSADFLEQIVNTAFPRCRVVDLQPFAEGWRNTNFRIQLSSVPIVMVLRIYEHDPSLCRKEVDLLNVIKHCVPTPEVIHAQPSGLNGVPPFVFMQYIDGVTFRNLKRSGEIGAISQAAYVVGQTLASICRTTFAKSGWVGPGPRVGAPLLEGENPAPRFVDLCLASATARRRMEPGLRAQTQALVWSYAAQLASLENERCLVHGDFGERNLLLQRVAGKWSMAAVLDWEFAISGSPLADVGQFLRYECAWRPLAEPHFSEGFLRAGGRLPDGWRRLARVLDLVALSESLTHDELSEGVVAELVELIRATVEDRDPLLRTSL